MPLTLEQTAAIKNATGEKTIIVLTANDAWITGALIEITPDKIILTANDITTTIPCDDIKALCVTRKKIIK